MIQHFQFKPLYTNTQLPGWRLSFFYERQKYEAEYLKDGQIHFIGIAPPKEHEEKIKKMVHELMLFHVYD